MAASGTTKKITVAELVTDSALTNKFWPNSTTALTGANLANGDKLAVVDVGSPDVAKYITADELAQGSQFSSRFVPKAGDHLFVPGGSMSILQGSPAADTTLGLGSGWLLDASANELLSGAIAIPSWWATYHVDVVWTNAGAGSGDVRFQMWSSSLADGVTASGSSSPAVDFTAPVQDVVEHSRLVSSANLAIGDVLGFYVGRIGTAAPDTLGNDCLFFGLRFVRAS
jgi:hypothetical protein